MSKTIENLKKAFAGESQANRHYIAYAKKADSEGYLQVAKLFRAVAEAETVHALNHLRIIGETKTTLENLKAAVSGETFEYSKMYPEYIRVAGEENDRLAVWSFEVANKVEEIHAGLFSQAINSLEDNKDLIPRDYYICSVCGNTVKNEAPKRCPICNAPEEKFLKAT